MDYFTDIYRMIPPNTRRVIDVGIGWGILGVLFKRWYKQGEKTLDGIELFQPYADRAQNHYDKIFVGDLRDILPTIPPKAYDVAVCTMVLEHFDVPESLTILHELERVAKRVIISSDNHFFANDIEFFEGNEAQEHKQLFTIMKARRFGYNCRGAGRMISAGVGTFKRVFGRYFDNWVGYKDCP